MRAILLIAALAVWALGAGAYAQAPAPGQTFPWKTVRLVSGVSPGSASDTMARVISEKLQANLGQPVIVENRIGGGGIVGAGFVAKAEPDGHTISVYTSSLTMVPFRPNPPFDAARDLAPVAVIATIPNVLIVSPARGWNTLQDLVAAAKARPGQLTYGSAGVGTSTHMGAEKFRYAAGIEVVHVPYKGAPEAVADVLAGRIDFNFAPAVAVMGPIREGKLRALAVGAAKRARVLPTVPTTVEEGYPGSDYNFWVGLLVASKTPRETVERLNDEVNKVMQLGDVRERLERLGAEVLTLSRADFETMIREEFEENAKLVKAAGIKLE